MQNHQTKTVNLTELCDKNLSRIPVAFAQKAPFTYRQDPQYAHFLSPLEHIRYVPGMEHLSYDHPRNPRWGVQPSDAKLNVPQVLRRGHKAAEPSYEPPVSNRPVRPPIRGTFRGKSKEEYMRIVEEDKERRAREAKEGCSSKVDSTSVSKQKASVGSSGLLKKRSRPTDTENAAKDVKSAKPAKCRLLSAELLRCRELLQTSFKEDHILLKYVADRLGHTYPNSVRIPVSRPRLDVNVPIPVPPNGPGFGPSRKREPSPSAITTPADPTGPKSGPSRKRVRSSSEVSISAAPGGPKSGSSRKRERSPAPKEENQQRKRAQQKPLSTPAAPVPPPVVAPAPVATSATPAQPAESSVISSGPVSTSTAPVASPAPPKVSPESVATSEAPVAPKAGSVAASTTPEVAATASDSDSPSQLRMYAKMFQRLALAYKRRGDSASTDVERLIDHLHAMCNYILGFFYADRSSNTFNKENWDSFHPFATAVSGQLKNMKEHEDLYAISLRLSSLVRFHAYGCLEAHAKQQLEKVLAAPRDNEEVLKRRLRITESTLKEYEHARALLRESERFLSFDQVSDRFPRTFQQVCLLGNLDAGAVLGGEAGTSTKPMYPWTPHSSLRHASLMAKAAIKEYLAKKSISFKEIRDLEEFFFV